MRSKIQRRFIIILVVTLIGIYLVAFPHGRWPAGKDFSSWTGFKNNLANNIHLGLDLRGGSHLVMRVDVRDFLKRRANKNIESAKNKLQSRAWAFNEITANDTFDKILVTVPDNSRNSDIIRELEDDFGPGWNGDESGNTITLTLSQDEKNQLLERATEQAKAIIENRINAFGVTEPNIQRHGGTGTYQILLQMPGIDDPDRVKNALNADSNLELKAVAKGSDFPAATKEAAENAAKALPGGQDNYEVFPYRERRPEGGTSSEGWGIVEKNPIVTGFDMRDASAAQTAQGSTSYEIHFSLSPQGAQRFSDWTGQHVNDLLAIVLNNEIKSAPKIESQISDRGRITGSFTKRAAEDLALVLRSGALPAKVEYTEERTVGPSLGADSIRQGVTVSVIGLAAVLLFMLVYYRFSGVNAVLALVLNLILLLAALVALEATLTLPGIAGVILTIGMAVDSNILIFERIREELRAGKVVSSAVQLGFDRAFLTIIDTHVTTVVSAAFLFVFGTGPIRGFAVTLVAGLLANLFTAVFVSKTIFLFVLNRKARVETLSI
jgi:preprotein translocase subunit SecD